MSGLEDVDPVLDVTSHLDEAAYLPLDPAEHLGTEPSTEQPERPANRHLGKPQQAELAKAIAEIIKQGYTLTNPELDQITPYYGYSSKTPASSVVGSPGFRKLVTANGAK